MASSTISSWQAGCRVQLAGYSLVYYVKAEWSDLISRIRNDLFRVVHVQTLQWSATSPHPFLLPSQKSCFEIRSRRTGWFRTL
jgi:hypothetical protein